MTIAGAQQKENLAVAYGNAATYALITTADPGTSIANEVSGGLYARKPITWVAGSVDGVVTATVVFDVPVGTAVSHTVLTTAATGGTFLDKVATAYTSQSVAGTLTVNLTYTQL